MPPKVDTPKVYRNKKSGKRHVRIKKKKILIPDHITEFELIKWLVEYLKPKRKKRKPKAEIAEHIFHDHAPNLSDENVLRVINFQRQNEGKPLYPMPLLLNAPVPVPTTAIVARPTPPPIPPRPRLTGDIKRESKSPPLEKKTELDVIGILDKSNKADRYEKERDTARSESQSERKAREEVEEKNRSIAYNAAVKELQAYYSRKDLYSMIADLPQYQADTVSRHRATVASLESDRKNNIKNMIDRLIEAKQPDVLHQLEILVKRQTGEGISDLAGGIRKGPSPSFRAFMKSHGEKNITHIIVGRNPVTKFVGIVANWLSLGKFNKNVKELGYEQMLHLFMIVTLDGGQKIKLEKNHFPEISTKYSLASTKDWKIETMEVPPPKQKFTSMPVETPKPVTQEVKQELAGAGAASYGTLNDFIKNAEKLAGGEENLFVYDAFTANCQYFVQYCLKGAHAWNDALKKFVMQDALGVIKGMTWFQKLAKTATDAANLADVAKNGRGEESSGAGLTNLQINDIMSTYKPHYLGTIPRDGWDQLTPPGHKGWSAWIMNTDKADRPGQHWVAFFLDLDHHTIEYYNSFADDIPNDVLVYLKNWLDKNNVSKGYLKLKVNRVIDQSATSSNCGWFCIRFIIDRSRGKKFSECTKYDEHVKGEKAIKEFKEKYGEFKYL